MKLTQNSEREMTQETAEGERKSGTTVVYRYPRNALMSDDLRALFGIAVGAFIALHPDALIAIRAIFAIILLIFLFFDLRKMKPAPLVSCPLLTE